MITFPHIFRFLFPRFREGQKTCIDFLFNMTWPMPVFSIIIEFLFFLSGSNAPIWYYNLYIYIFSFFVFLNESTLCIRSLYFYILLCRVLKITYFVEKLTYFKFKKKFKAKNKLDLRRRRQRTRKKKLFKN